MWAEFGALNILVANAGIAVQGNTVDGPTLDASLFYSQWMVNVLGTVAGARAAAQTAHRRRADRVYWLGPWHLSAVPMICRLRGNQGGACWLRALRPA